MFQCVGWKRYVEPCLEETRTNSRSSSFGTADRRPVALQFTLNPLLAQECAAAVLTTNWFRSSADKEHSLLRRPGAMVAIAMTKDERGNSKDK